MNALRFVLEGSGATTIVDGKPCPMEEGDLVLTPAWTWHEHVHQGSAPIIWLDALDVPLHHYMGTGAFQPGPVGRHAGDDRRRGLRGRQCRARHELRHASDYSPVFRYPYARPRRRLLRLRRRRATARGACATSIRSPAAPAWR